MKRYMTMAGMLLLCVVFAGGIALGAGSTLYDQENETDPDPVEVDGAESMPTGGTVADNWVHQYGSGSWSGVYGDGGWAAEVSGGDSEVEIEADVEMYASTTTSNNKIYFHLGNVDAATSGDLTAYIDGTLVSNNGQYVGISFLGQGKTSDDFETDNGDLTGVITGGMQSDRHSYGTQNEAMDVKFLMKWNGTGGNSGGFVAPSNFGAGAHGTITKALWWKVTSGAGSYTLQWQVRLLPDDYQADGDYYIDPVVVTAPVL